MNSPKVPFAKQEDNGWLNEEVVSLRSGQLEP